MTTVRTAAVLGLLLVTACGGRAPAEAEMFLVRSRAETRASTGPEGAPIVRVAPIDVAAHLRGITIITPDDRVRTLINQRFAAPLPAMVEDVIVDQLRASGRFGAVLPSTNPGHADLGIRLGLKAFEIVVGGKGYQARVGFEATVERAESRTVAAAFVVDRFLETEGTDTPAFVKALETCLNTCAAEIVARVVALQTTPGLPTSAPSRDG